MILSDREQSKVRAKGTVYKFTQTNRTASHGFEYPVGKWCAPCNVGYGVGRGKLCSSAWLHAYESLYLAALHWSSHTPGYNSRILWEAEWSGKMKRDGYIKLGVTKLRIMRKITTPRVNEKIRNRYVGLILQAINAKVKKFDLGSVIEIYLSGKAPTLKQLRSLDANIHIHRNAGVYYLVNYGFSITDAKDLSDRYKLNLAELAEKAFKGGK